jgi:hypothetical protein
MEASPVCDICHEENRLRDTYICPSCKKSVCDACCYRFGGRPFCRKSCADFFFFGDEDAALDD